MPPARCAAGGGDFPGHAVEHDDRYRIISEIAQGQRRVLH